MSSQLAGCAASREQSGDVHTTRHARCSWRQSPLAGQGASHEKSDHIPFVTLDGFMAGPQGETDGMDPLSGFREKDKSSVKQKGNTMYTIIPLSDFQINATAYRFEGGIYWRCCCLVLPGPYSTRTGRVVALASLCRSFSRPGRQGGGCCGFRNSHRRQRQCRHRPCSDPAQIYQCRHDTIAHARHPSYQRDHPVPA